MLSFLRRYRAAFVAAPFCVMLIGAVLWMSGLRLAETLFSSEPSERVAERLLLAIERDSARTSPQRLVDHLPANFVVPDDIRRAIRQASNAVGVDKGYLIAVAARESSFDAAARARESTALGLYQFTEDTWLRVVKLFGDRHGLGSYAQGIDIDESGSVAMRSGALRDKLLRLRRNPQLSALMAAELARDNKMRLERLLGRGVSPSEIYIAHFLGVAQAAKMIAIARSTPQMAGSRLLPVAAESNPGVFGDAEAPLSVGVIVAEIDAYFRDTVARIGS